MSKITFRADDDLVRRLEEFDASKSEVMREALRAYLDGAGRDASASASTASDTVDDALAARVDSLIAERLDAQLDARFGRTDQQDINVNISLDGSSASAEPSVNASSTANTSDASAVDAPDRSDDGERKTDVGDAGDDAHTQTSACDQCGENVSAGHVYCPNCGEKTSHRVFCDCGDELRSDWAFCPGCGRRTPAADVLDRP